MLVTQIVCVVLVNRIDASVLTMSWGYANVCMSLNQSYLGVLQNGPIVCYSTTSLLVVVK